MSIYPALSLISVIAVVLLERFVFRSGVMKTR